LFETHFFGGVEVVLEFGVFLVETEQLLDLLVGDLVGSRRLFVRGLLDLLVCRRFRLRVLRQRRRKRKREAQQQQRQSQSIHKSFSANRLKP
jgi:hypothetical protein